MAKIERVILPRHIAIIMDGNGRWAQKRFLPRQAGHRSGLKVARHIIQACIEHGIGTLTLFAFSSENWRRPKDEVNNLVELFIDALKSEIDELHKNNVRVHFIGDRTAFSRNLQDGMQQAESRTLSNTALRLNIATSYGGRWDLLQAAKHIALEVQAGTAKLEEVDEARFSQALTLANEPDPDLFIRTGGEQRISNFLLWNLAYTELYFTETLWPDFNSTDLQLALDWYAARQRRFGRISEQVGILS